MKIAHREIGPHVPPLIVAEIGIAHGGDAHVAMNHIAKVHAAGAEAVKMQAHGPLEEEMHPEHPWWDTIERCMLTPEELRECKRYAESLGLIWFATPFTLTALGWLLEMDVPAIKIGSGEVSFPELCERACLSSLSNAEGLTRNVLRPVIVSDGLGGDLDRATSVPAAEPGFRVGFYGALRMRCISRYPADARVVDEEDQSWFDCDGYYGYDGWSDHTGDIAASLAAIAHGAQVIEIHVPREGPDAEASVTWAQFAELVRLAPLVWQAAQPAEPVDVSEVARLARRDRDPSGRGRRMP